MDSEAPRMSNGAATGGSGRAAVRPSPENGYAMAALLVGMGVMAVIMSAAMPVWSTAAKRLKEDELVFRGEQYARAIALYQRKYANQLPPSIDVLVNERFLRRKYLDPITGQEFQALTGAVGQAAPGLGAGGRGAPAPGGQTGRGLGTGASGTDRRRFGRGRARRPGTTGFQGRQGPAGAPSGIGSGTGIGAGRASARAAAGTQPARRSAAPAGSSAWRARARTNLCGSTTGATSIASGRSWQCSASCRQAVARARQRPACRAAASPHRDNPTRALAARAALAAGRTPSGRPPPVPDRVAGSGRAGHPAARSSNTAS